MKRRRHKNKLSHHERSYESPIEVVLGRALHGLGPEFKIQSQVHLLHYRVDFLVEHRTAEGNRRIVVEADGAAYHGPDRAEADATRDADILRECGLRTLRFAGSEIARRATWCAVAVADALSQTQASPDKNSREWHKYLNRKGSSPPTLNVAIPKPTPAVRNDIRF